MDLTNPRQGNTSQIIRKNRSRACLIQEAVEPERQLDKEAEIENRKVVIASEFSCHVSVN